MRFSRGAAGPQCSGNFSSKCATTLKIERSIDGFVGYLHLVLVRNCRRRVWQICSGLHRKPNRS